MHFSGGSLELSVFNSLSLSRFFLGLKLYFAPAEQQKALMRKATGPERGHRSCITPGYLFFCHQERWYLQTQEGRNNEESQSPTQDSWTLPARSQPAGSFCWFIKALLLPHGCAAGFSELAVCAGHMRLANSILNRLSTKVELNIIYSFSRM